MAHEQAMSGTPSWFRVLFGAEERVYAATRELFQVVGTDLLCLPTGERFRIGAFATPSLAELRALVPPVPTNSPVASQFNCLEFVSPSEQPEHGVTEYASDPTQGPACALSCAPATVYRNYFVPVPGNGEETRQLGQTRGCQLNNLRDLEYLLQNEAHRYFTVQSGYVLADNAGLKQLNAALQQMDRELLLQVVRVGVQRDVQVTFASRFTRLSDPERKQIVTQVFCSAVSVAYANGSAANFQPLACLVLDATYEATLLAALINAADSTGTNKVLLTFIGGGAFGNDLQWICGAIGRACARLRHHNLDVHIVHRHSVNDKAQYLIERAFASFADAC